MPPGKARSDGAPLRDLDEMRWIGDIPRAGAKQAPDRPALVFAERNRTWTYAQLNDYANAFASIVAARGLKPGARIAYLGRNNDIYYAVLFGAIRARVVLVPINWRMSPTEIAYQLQDSGSAWLLVDGDLQDLANAASEQFEDLLEQTLVESNDEERPSLLQLLERTEDSSTDLSPHDPEQTVLQMYTSGTTGVPKGVLISHRALSIARHAELISPEWEDWTEGGVSLSAMPNFHIGGMSWILIGLLRQATVVVTADPSPGNMVALLQAHSIERVFLVATVLRAIVDELQSNGKTVPSLRGIYYGAMPMDETLLRQAIALFDCRFGQFFGMTEVTGTATYLPPDQHDPARPERLKSVGRPIAGMSLEIRDSNRNLLDVGQHGEIWIKAPTLMQGYWNLPEATREVIVDGWYITGDGGYLDDEGFLYLTDRIKDMILTGGENVYPAEVEAALLKHPAVLAAAVVGVPEKRWGEMVVAVLEIRTGHTVDENELLAHVRREIASYKCPKVIRFGSLPRTASGKVQRRQLRSSLSDEFSTS